MESSSTGAAANGNGGGRTKKRNYENNNRDGNGNGNNNNRKWKRNRSNTTNNNKKTWYNKDEGQKEKERQEWAAKQSERRQQNQFQLITKQKNEVFEKYYRAQNIVSSEEEFEKLLNQLRYKLPTTFRISSINGVENSLLNYLKQAQPKLESVNIALEDGREYSAPRPLPWYPNSMAWQTTVGRFELKKIPQLKQFRQWIMAEFDQGNLNRQEAVSMIPPLLLDVQPNHYVLDMCAAPGSKTAQLLEGLHQRRSNRVDDSKESNTDPSNNTNTTQSVTMSDILSGEGADGMVIANDADPRRAYMLVHQLKRLGSPSFLVTTHDGQRFPTLYMRDMKNKEAQIDTPVEFDRILCDVPCSGDGTLRKNIGLWKHWTPAFGHGLHALQIAIAVRGLQMLKVGGLMVYSTCSFNPTENEAVVAELLRLSQGSVELVDVSDRLPGLIRSPGLSTWKVMNDRGELFEWNEQIQEAVIEGSSTAETESVVSSESASTNESEAKRPLRQSKYRKSAFPPTAEEVQMMHLERCMRILPHAQDTGGFFITLMRKVKPWPKPSATSIAKTDESTNVDANEMELEVDPSIDNAMDLAMKLEEIDDDADEGKPNNHQKGSRKDNYDGKYNDDPFVPMDDSVIQRIIEFFGLSSDIDHSNFFTRSDLNRKCYFVSPAISRLLTSTRNTKLKIVHSGARCYERSRMRTNGPNFRCDYRVVQEGIDAISPFMSRQLLHPTFEQFATFLEKDSLTTDYFRKLPSTDKFGQEGLAGENGCMVMIVTGDKIREMTTKPLAVAVWKTDRSISLMLPKPEKTSLMNLLGIVPQKKDPVISQAKGAVATKVAESHGVIDRATVEATVEEVITEASEGPVDSAVVQRTVNEIESNPNIVATLIDNDGMSAVGADVANTD